MNARPAPPGAFRRLPPVVAALVRIEARRPASWLVAGAILAVVALVPPARAWAAAGAGALLGLAALGSLRRAARAVEILPARLVARLLWPLAAAAAGAAVASLAGQGGSGRTAVAVAAAAGVVVVAAAVAAVAASARLPQLRRLSGDRAESGPGPGVDRWPRHVGRTWADAAAMLSTLVAMAVCYFLAPEQAGWYAVVATTWFTLLAVPAATLVGGDEELRRAVVNAGPGRPRLAGTPAAAGPTLAAYAAVLGWPAAVAAAVARRGAAGWGDPLGAVAAVAGMAVAAAALVWISAVLRWREDTTHALLVAAHAVAIALVAWIS